MLCLFTSIFRKSGGYKDKSLILLDNSFRERYCYFDETPQEEVCRKWNMVIDSIESKLSSFSGDYQFIDIPVCMLESVGFGKLIREDDARHRKCFPAAGALLIPESQFNEKSLANVVKYFDSQFCSTFEKLVEFYKDVIDLNEMINKIENKMQQKLHPNVVPDVLFIHLPYGSN